MDKQANPADMRKTMARVAGKTSVPQIWINGEHIGGCDDLKALEATGDLGTKLKALRKNINTDVAEAGDTIEAKGTSAAVTIFPGPEAAFLLPFHSPATMDNRVVRLNGVLGFVISAATCVFANQSATQWVVLGLTVDFGLKLGGFPSPLSMLAALPLAGTRPDLTPGASKQFANFCGIFMAFIAWAFLVLDMTLLARIFLVMLAVATSLQGFVNFCLGCYIFKDLLAWGFVRRSVYRMHISTRSSTMYAWERVNVRTGKGTAPEAVTFPTKGVPWNPTDLKVKPGRADDKWERFHLIKYLHMNYFMIPLSVLGLGLPWKLHSVTYGTTEVPWLTCAYVGAVLDASLLVLLLLKCIIYPSKVRKEFNHPLHRNSFALPFLIFVVMARLSANWTDPLSTDDLSKVLYWMGSVPLALLTWFSIASWVASPADHEYIQPSWMLMPVGNFIGAAATRSVNPDYYEWGWFLYSTGILLWIALWPITFGKAISDHHSDIRTRSLFAIWVAPPAMAMLAYHHLEGAEYFDLVQRLLYYPALSIGLAIVVCTWPLDFFQEGDFNMSHWAFAFPLDALAAASVLAYSQTNYDAMKVIYIVVLSSACTVNVVNLLATLGALKARTIFTPAPKWSPLAYVEMVHEAFREALPKIEKLAAAANPGLADASSVRTLSNAWSTLTSVHALHTRAKEQVIFPELEGFFPGQTKGAIKQREELDELISSIQSTIDALLGRTLGEEKEYDQESVRAALMAGLRADIKYFAAELVENLDQEELVYAAPVARKYLPIRTAKDLVRKVWETTSHSEMSDLITWVMATLRIRGQRTNFLKSWIWAMPERAQQLGLMVYRVVDDVTWIEVASDVPEAIPRGLPGHRRYF
ncbi:unnamed protein product [Ascophyllum nodosum]